MRSHSSTGPGNRNYIAEGDENEMRRGAGLRVAATLAILRIMARTRHLFSWVSVEL